MNYFFFDSSVLVKVHAEEEGSRKVRAIVERARQASPQVRVVLCDLALPEVTSALARKADEDESGVTDDDVALRGEQLESEIMGGEGPYIVVQASGVMTRAAELTREHALMRGADAVHLAAAIALRVAASGSESFTFATADRRLLAAAEEEGFSVLDPQTER